MNTATLPQAIDVMRHGNHCLWVGAGVTIQLVGGTHAPSWQTLTTNLETATGLTPGLFITDFPARLGVCKAILGEITFRQRIRTEIHDRMYLQIIQMALDAQTAGHLDPPTSIKALAHLGAIGNPIVSFNIEMATAIALSMPNGRPLIKTYSKSARHHLSHILFHRPVSLGRKVFLPHGCLELADSVLTKDEYISHQASMSFQLATHQAYASGLFIVGMSLGDQYLLDQIERFREWIGEIYWIQPEASSAQEELAERYSLTLVRDGSWTDFWRNFDRPLNGDLEPKQHDLIRTWDKLIADALNYLDRPLYDEAEAMDSKFISAQSQDLLAQSFSAGEGRPLPTLPPDTKPSLQAYRAALQAAATNSEAAARKIP